jgi:hypothetical protein
MIGTEGWIECSALTILGILNVRFVLLNIVRVLLLWLRLKLKLVDLSSTYWVCTGSLKKCFKRAWGSDHSKIAGLSPYTSKVGNLRSLLPCGVAWKSWIMSDESFSVLSGLWLGDSFEARFFEPSTDDPDWLVLSAVEFLLSIYVFSRAWCRAVLNLVMGLSSLPMNSSFLFRLTIG